MDPNKETTQTHPEHQGLMFKSIKTTVNYSMGVSVDWLAKKHPSRTDNDNTEYSVTVRGPSNIAFSLFTLMIQSVAFKVVVKNDNSPGEVTLIDGSDVHHTLNAIGIDVEGTGKKNYGAHNPKEIWFLKFSGPHCTLVIEAQGRLKIRGTDWDPAGPVPTSGRQRMLVSHDNMPPGGTTEK